MIFLVLGAIAVVAILCICMSMNKSSGAQQQSAEAAHKSVEIAQDNNISKNKARRPDDLKSLLSEEFPNFSSNFTYSRCEDAINRHSSFDQSVRFSKFKKFTGVWKNDEARREAFALLINDVYQSFSKEFRDYLQRDPEESSIILTRIMQASETMSKR